MRAPTLAVLLFASACDGVPRNVEYYSDVQPILEDHCVRCHQPGGVGPFDLTAPALAASWAEVIAAATESGSMPPAVSDPECRDYLGSEHLAVTYRERKVLGRWADRGAPMGDAAEAVSGTQAPASLDDADLHVKIPSFTPTYEDPISDDMGAIENMLAAWPPGSAPQIFQPGAGMRVGAGQVLLLQMHYCGWRTIGRRTAWWLPMPTTSTTSSPTCSASPWT